MSAASNRRQTATAQNPDHSSAPGSSDPWPAGGVDPEAREAAKIAARRANLTLDQWLSQSILSAAARELSRGGRGDQAPNRSWSAPRHTTSRGRAPALTMDAVLDSIQRLANRIEDSEARTADALRPLADKLNQLSQRVEDVRESAAPPVAPLERALMRLSDRLDGLESNRKPEVARRSGFFARVMGR
ncbi:MAG: hypothetical protein RIE31_06830 [Alphaproteobacteria bacterium]